MASVAFEPGGKSLACGSYDQTINLWELPSGKLFATLKGHTDSVESLAFSSDRKWLASGSRDKSVKLWAMPSRKLAATLKGHADWVSSVIFDPQGRWLASCSDDGTVNLWELPSGKLTATLERDTKLMAVSADGKWRAGAYDKIVKLWEVPSGKLATTSKGHAEVVSSVAFSPDGKWLASSSNDKTLRLWELPSGAPTACFFDVAALAKGKTAVRLSGVDKYGHEIFSTVACGAPIPAGATCTCN